MLLCFLFLNEEEKKGIFENVLFLFLFLYRRKPKNLAVLSLIA